MKRVPTPIVDRLRLAAIALIVGSLAATGLLGSGVRDDVSAQVASEASQVPDAKAAQSRAEVKIGRQRTDDRDNGVRNILDVQPVVEVPGMEWTRPPRDGVPVTVGGDDSVGPVKGDRGVRAGVRSPVKDGSGRKVVGRGERTVVVEEADGKHTLIVRQAPWPVDSKGEIIDGEAELVGGSEGLVMQTAAGVVGFEGPGVKTGLANGDSGGGSVGKGVGAGKGLGRPGAAGSAVRFGRPGAELRARFGDGSLGGVPERLGRRNGAERVVYRNVFKDADVEYSVVSTDVLKEEIVLRSRPSGVVEYRFPLELDGLTPRVVDGRVEFLGDDGGLEIVVPPGMMFQEKYTGAMKVPDGQKTPGKPAATPDLPQVGVVSVGLEGSADVGWTLVVRPDMAWLTAPHRVFPVRIDPSFSSGATAWAIVVEGYPAQGTGSGYPSVGGFWAWYRTRTFWALPALPASSAIQSASISYQSPACWNTYTDPLTQAYWLNAIVGPAASAWTPLGVAWSNQPGILDSRGIGMGPGVTGTI